MQKNKKKSLKEEKGAISTLVLFTVLVFLAILMGSYLITTTLLKSQLKSNMRIAQIYGEDVDRVDEIYKQQIEVSRIGETSYETLQEAISAIKDKEDKTEIVITKDIVALEPIIILENQKIELLLKGNTITGTIQNNGNLTIGDTGTITSENNATIENKGILIIAGATITNSASNGCAVLQKKGNTIVESGTISSTAEEIDNEDNITSALEITSGTATLSGGKISSNNGKAVENNGVIELSGSTIISKANYATVYNLTEGTVNMTDGNIENTSNGYAVSNKGTWVKTGGSIIGMTEGIETVNEDNILEENS